MKLKKLEEFFSWKGIQKISNQEIWVINEAIVLVVLQLLSIRWRQLNFLFYRQLGEYFQVIMMLSFIGSTSKTKKYESARLRMEAITSLLHDSTLSNVLNFCFYLFYCNHKQKDHIWRKINSTNKNIDAWTQY